MKRLQFVNFNLKKSFRQITENIKKGNQDYIESV